MNVAQSVALEAAIADGYELDCSPGTEMSNEVWYRLDSCHAPIREDDLIARYEDVLEAQAEERAEMAYEQRLSMLSEMHYGNE